MPKISNPKPTTAIQPVLLTIKQAANALQVSDRTVFNLLAAGDLKSVRIGRARRIRTQDLEAFAAAGLEREDDTRGTYLRQRDEINRFWAEWLTADQIEEWQHANNDNIRLLIDAYRGEINRLLSNRPSTAEWLAVLEAARPVAKTMQDRLKAETSELPLSDPQSLADRAYSFAVDAGYQFASSLGTAQKLTHLVEHDE